MNALEKDLRGKKPTPDFSFINLRRQNGFLSTRRKYEFKEAVFKRKLKF